MEGESVDSQPLWLAVPGSLQFPGWPFVQNASVGKTELVVGFILCLINRCVFPKSNFKLRFLGNKLHVCNKQPIFFFWFCLHATKKDQVVFSWVRGCWPSHFQHLTSLLHGLAASSVMFHCSLSLSFSHLSCPGCPEPLRVSKTNPDSGFLDSSFHVVTSCGTLGESHHLADDVTREREWVWVSLWEGNPWKWKIQAWGKVQGNAAFNPMWEDLCLGSPELPRGDRGILLHMVPTQRDIETNCEKQIGKLWGWRENLVSGALASVPNCVPE